MGTIVLYMVGAEMFGETRRLCRFYKDSQSTEDIDDRKASPGTSIVTFVLNFKRPNLYFPAHFA
jgi:hypothetical protein